MNFFSQLFLGFLLLLIPSSTQADLVSEKLLGDINRQTFANAAFAVTDPNEWYVITLEQSPITVPLSLNRNKGFSHGGINLTDTGVEVLAEGSYSVNISIVLQNNGVAPVLVNVNLVNNELLDPNDALLGTVALLQPGALETISTAGIVPDIITGTELSLVGSNGGSGTADLTIVAWQISLSRI